MFKKIVLLLSVVSVTLLTSSCFTVGDQFPSAVSWIKPHETTRAEIEKAFGPPFRTGYDSGLMTYSYGYYKYSALSDSQTKDLTVRFNDKNIVESYTFSSSFPEDQRLLQSGVSSPG